MKRVKAKLIGAGGVMPSLIDTCKAVEHTENAAEAQLAATGGDLL